MSLRFEHRITREQRSATSVRNSPYTDGGVETYHDALAVFRRMTDGNMRKGAVEFQKMVGSHKSFGAEAITGDPRERYAGPQLTSPNVVEVDIKYRFARRLDKGHAVFSKYPTREDRARRFDKGLVSSNLPGLRVQYSSVDAKEKGGRWTAMGAAVTGAHQHSNPNPLPSPPVVVVDVPLLQQDNNNTLVVVKPPTHPSCRREVYNDPLLNAFNSSRRQVSRVLSFSKASRRT